MGVATGTFQYPNGSPVANGVYQWKLNTDAVLISTAAVCPVLFQGKLDAQGNMTATFAFNDILSTQFGTNTTYQLTVKAPGIQGGQVWNEQYYLTGTAANLNFVAPTSSPPNGPYVPINFFGGSRAYTTWINVKDHGANGTGFGDDTAAIQAAINACSSTQGIVYFPTGNYPISATLTNSANLTGLIGDGSTSSVISTNGSWVGKDGVTITPPTPGTKIYGFTVRGLQFVGPGKGTASVASAYSITSDVVTITASNTFTSGEQVLVQGFLTSGGSVLNNAFVTVLSSGLSGSQFEFNFTTADGSGSDVAVIVPDQNGLAFVNTGTSSDGPYGLILEDILSSNWPGDGVKLIDCIVSEIRNVQGQSCGGNAIGLYSPNQAGASVCGTSLTFLNCYGNGCYKAGFYSYLLVYSSFVGCACDNCGTAYYMERSEALSFSGCGFENLVYQNTAYPANGYWLHGVAGAALVGCRGFVGHPNNIASVTLAIDTTLTGGSRSSSDIGAYSFRNTGSGSATQPTNDFTIDANAQGCVIWGWTFFNAANYTVSNVNNLVWIDGTFRNTVTFQGSLVTDSTVVFQGTGGTVRCQGSITASAGAAQMFNTNGTLISAANNDVLIFNGSQSGFVTNGANTGVKVYAYHSNMNNITFTGTAPSICAEYHASGSVSAGTTNYGFYEDGTNPNFLGGLLTCDTGLKVNSGGIKGNTLELTSAAAAGTGSDVVFGSGTSASATTGGVQTVPLAVAGYLVIYIGATSYKVPYFAV